MLIILERGKKPHQMLVLDRSFSTRQAMLSVTNMIYLSNHKEETEEKPTTP